MRKLLLLSVALLLCVCRMTAVPSHPGTVTVQQPDGSTLTLRLLGDEWLHFNTTADGYTVVKDSRGYYVYAELQNGRLCATAQVAHDATGRSAAEQAYLVGKRKYQAPAMTEQNARLRQEMQQRQRKTLVSRRAAQYDYNNFRGLIILIEYNDKSFSREDYADIIEGMVNEENYTGYTGKNGHFESYTGSVRDYFTDNSNGKFQPEFDVVGPYTVDYSQYYVNATANANEIINSVLDIADPDVDYSQYDGDGDGVVDLVFFIVAGNGANYGGNDGRLWWPHRSIVYNPYATDWSDWAVVKDGVMLLDYASSVELAGYTTWPMTVKIDGIGTICHEFSHVLGLPDFYDTDYEGSGGESVSPGHWSVMAGGSYSNDSRTPVGYSLYERYAVGFSEEPPVIDAEGSYTLDALYINQEGFRINSSVDNEFFLLENRQRTAFKWDAYLPGSGLLVHRVDQTNMDVWTSNTINNNPARNYYEVVRAGGMNHAETEYDVFPGTANVTELHNTTSPANLKTWAGHSTKWGLQNIARNDGVITFDIINTFVLESIGLPETATAQIGLPLTLTAALVPDYVDCALTWESSNEAIATVDQQGNVSGVSAGDCTITVTAENGMEASCLLTVQEPVAITVADFVQLEPDTQVLLQLTDAQVLYVDKKNVYLRDATGSVILNNIGLTLKKNQVINGSLFVQASVSNGMMQVKPISGITDVSGLAVVMGDESQPREVQLEDLTVADYADYVLIKNVQMEIDNGYWIVSGEKRVRLRNIFKIRGVTLPNDVEGKTFDVEGIFGTDLNGTELVDEIYLLKSVVEIEQVDPPSGILDIRHEDDDASPAFDLQGRPVSPNHRGLVIRRGKKVLNK